ncbi:hypothetical protein [Actinocrispum sp. NPDC049592]|uniref:hypothetical protein n=1 Tax=Actinocrispum sp. NPDC049592 TaxID=3154835 RepID=UPI003446B5F3
MGVEQRRAEARLDWRGGRAMVGWRFAGKWWMWTSLAVGVLGRLRCRLGKVRCGSGREWIPDSVRMLEKARCRLGTVRREPTTERIPEWMGTWTEARWGLGRE